MLSNTLIFTDSITKGIRMHEFNRFIKNGKATMFNFTSASFHQMHHYLDVHFEGTQINTVVIRVGINDILRDSSQSNIDGLLQDMRNMSLKCKNLSRLLYLTRINIVTLEKNHIRIQNFARNTAGFMLLTETYEESIYTKMAFI